MIDLMRPDGSGRFRTIAGAVNSSIIDVAVLDRYEIYSRTGKLNNQLIVYDITARHAVLVAQGVGQVLSRHGILWWSTGDNETVVWHSLDLRALV
jgi:hypothetical protein